MAAMRVLLLSDWMTNPGGSESYITGLRRALLDEGDEVCLLTSGAGVATPAADIAVFGTDARIAQALLQVDNPFASRGVRDAVAMFRPDVALVSHFAYHLSPSVFDMLREVPFAVTLMDYKVICPLGTRLLPDGSVCRATAGRACVGHGCIGNAHWLRDRSRYTRIRRGLERASVVICASRWMQAELARAGIDAQVIPLGVRDDLAPAANPSADPLFVYLGRLSREKGVAVLIAAFSKCLREFPRARLRIIGDGPIGPDLKALASTLGVSESVEFAGWAEGDLVHAQMNDAWAVVCPSLWAEPFGIAAVEAMLAGIPVIASDSGGFADTVEHGVTGLRVPPGDVAALAVAMKDVMSRPASGTRLDAAARSSVRSKFAMSTHVTLLRPVFEEMIVRGRGS